MQITQIKLKNFRAFQNVEMRDIPHFAVLVGANGTGKSTLFSVFGFLREAMTSNVTTALAKLGASRGFKEVVSRNSKGPIEIEIKFREKPTSQLVTYTLQIAEKKGQPIVQREILNKTCFEKGVALENSRSCDKHLKPEISNKTNLKYRRGAKGAPWKLLDFSQGKGQAVTNELEEVKDEKDLKREEQKLKSPDLLAIKGLAQFERFPAVVALGDLIERWHISDFHINQARPEQEAGYAEHLSRTGENLSLVVEYLSKNHRSVFEKIIEQLSKRVPGITRVESKQTEEGRILLKFQDGEFEDPFLARYVSDGTIKMLAYLILLYDPKPHPLLCVEEPENQLYQSLLEELAEEFRVYSNKGGQVFVSTHSPDFLNSAELDEVFLMTKKAGYTVVQRAKDNETIVSFMKNGAKMGHLWREGLFEGADPE